MKKNKAPNNKSPTPKVKKATSPRPTKAKDPETCSSKSNKKSVSNLKKSEYLFKVKSPKNQHQNGQEPTETVMRFERPDWSEPGDQSETSFKKHEDRKIHSDQQSTKANGLLESGELLQNKQLYFTKMVANSDAEQKVQPLQNNPEKRNCQKEIVVCSNKYRKKSETKNLRESLKSRIQEFKLLQKKHDQQIDDLKARLSADESHRLSKIQSVEKFQIHEQIKQLEKKTKEAEHLKYSHQIQTAKSSEEDSEVIRSGRDLKKHA